VLRRAQKIRLKLNGSASMVDPFPERPRWMHHLTYERHRARYLALERASLLALGAFVRRNI
jgi:hypothetical protein